jgi:hypothetical protein
VLVRTYQKAPAHCAVPRGPVSRVRYYHNSGLLIRNIVESSRLIGPMLVGQFESSSRAISLSVQT